MIVDTSAITAVLRNEREAAGFALALAGSTTSRMSSGTYLEAAIVVDASGDPVLSARFDELVSTAGIEIVPVDADAAGIARAAYRDYGRGSGHAARLNFGDCFAYALARATSEPLLFTGDDFAATDLVPASPQS